MKCKYCNAEIEQDARFCPNCGKDLSSLARCVNCGEFLDDEDAFCPHCGAKQPQQEVVEDVIEDEGKDNSTRNFLIALLLTFALAGAAWFYFTKDSKSPVVTNVDVDTLHVDTLSMEVDKMEDNDGQIAFIEKLYDDFYSMEQEVFLKKYFTPSAMKKIYVENSYEEGSFLYATDFLVGGKISDMQPDWGNKVTKRTIEHFEDDWFVVTNIWDVIDKPVKVFLEVKKVDGNYMITDVRAEKNEETIPAVEENNIGNENNVAEPKETESVDNDEPVAQVSPKEDNVAYYVFGTKKELEDNRVLSNGKVYFNKSYFTKIDIRIDKEIKLYSKSAKILTNHPASSYSLVPDGNMQYILRINDPQLFWSSSKILVILVS